MLTVQELKMNYLLPAPRMNAFEGTDLIAIVPGNVSPHVWFVTEILTVQEVKMNHLLSAPRMNAFNEDNFIAIVPGDVSAMVLFVTEILTVKKVKMNHLLFAVTVDECFRRDRALCPNDKCISTSWLCDGARNCPFGEDELDWTCGLKHQCESNRSMRHGCLGECKPGYFGKYCEMNCLKKCLNGICDKSSGICNECASGYTGDYCNKPCSKECLNGICDKSNGICNECVSGYTGEYCNKTCSKECLNGRCNISSGLCNNCTRTYLESCSQECGEGCREINGFPQCDRQSGKCFNGCKFYHYGFYCNNTCKNCKRNSSTSPCDNNGVCQFGCENDYWDKKCNSKCSVNCQGDDNGKRCNSSTGECKNGCTRGWSGKFCGESTDKENVNSLKTTFIVIPVIATVVVVVVGIICCFWARKRFNRQLNERIEPRRVFRAPRQQPSRSRRRQSSALYADINEETMDHYHYICKQNLPDHYDKIKDRKPCICPPCVRERVDPILNRISSGSSSTTFVEPYATGGGSLRRSSIHSYISNRELNPRRSVTTNERVSGILPTKELTDDSYSRRSIIKFDGKNGLDSTVECKPRRSVSYSDGDLGRVGKTDNTNEVKPRPCGSKSKSSIELVCTHEYLDLEELYQKAKAEDKRKLAAKYFDEGEEVFGEIGQFQANYIHAIEREECEELNIELDHLNLGQNVESSVEIGQSEQIEESCFANDKDFSVEQQPAQSQNDENLDDPKDTDRRSDEIKQTDTLF
ncbi:TENX-like protein [Mya arenaria]|uniref:TENX-like protein n=1 Tax=Mya arenaria TaxID=6604 RepID=A0ABY7D864_MYAAR|nr:TENX-like protein [Mya arenaria]